MSPSARDARRGTAALGAIAIAFGSTAIARAHPDAAESPVWDDGKCIEVVDLSTTNELMLPYGVPFDDTEYELGDIVLDDAKTHQFFAFRGVLAPYNLGSQIFPFDRPIDETIVVPEWIDTDDVKRAADAANEKDATFFTEDKVPLAERLDGRDDLQPYWLTITDKAERVPIVAKQAALGLRWDLRGATPGLYQVSGYVFSPPYNAWAPRPGLIVLVDGKQPAPPAITVDPIDGFLFAGQGRRVRGCVHALDGAHTEAFYRSEDVAGEPWQRFEGEVSIEDGHFELCWTSPDPDLSGVVRVRVDVTAPDGGHAYGYSPDTMVVVGTKSACTESESTCCKAAEPAKPMAMQGGAGGAGAGGGPAAGTGSGAAGSGSGGAGASAGAAGSVANAPPAMMPVENATPEGDSGCRAAGGTGTSTGSFSIVALAALAWIRRRRRPC